MRIFSVLAVLLLSVCPSLAQIPLSLADYNDGTWAYSGYEQVAEEPSASQQAEYAKAGYEQMKAHGEELNLKTPNTMTAAYWPNPNGRGGTIILHSSITNGLENVDTREYLNTCNIAGKHRYRGMCGEIANMTWAKVLRETCTINTNNQVRWAVYGIVNKRTGATDWMLPCRSTGGTNGCQVYVDALAEDAGGGGTCIMKRGIADVASANR